MKGAKVLCWACLLLQIFGAVGCRRASNVMRDRPAGEAFGAARMPTCAETACYLAVRATNRQATFAEVQDKLKSFGGGAESASLLSMKKTVETFGLNPVGTQTSVEALTKQSGAAILHLNLPGGRQHFSYCQLKDGKISMFDPLLVGPDPRVVSADELADRATGYVLLFQDATHP